MRGAYDGGITGPSHNSHRGLTAAVFLKIAAARRNGCITKRLQGRNRWTAKSLPGEIAAAMKWLQTAKPPQLRNALDEMSSVDSLSNTSRW
jgi:hypothetical protein